MTYSINEVANNDRVESPFTAAAESASKGFMDQLLLAGASPCIQKDGTNVCGPKGDKSDKPEGKKVDQKEDQEIVFTNDWLS